MKFTIALAAAIAALPASAKTWVDVECSRVLISADDRFVIAETGKPLTTCEIGNWPVNTPTADMKCAGGIAAKMELINDRSLLWNGVEMNAYDGPLPCGSDGAEWPD